MIQTDDIICSSPGVSLTLPLSWTYPASDETQPGDCQEMKQEESLRPLTDRRNGELFLVTRSQMETYFNIPINCVGTSSISILILTVQYLSCALYIIERFLKLSVLPLSLPKLFVYITGQKRSLRLCFPNLQLNT